MRKHGLKIEKTDLTHMPGKWYVHTDGTHYLHNDGVIRYGTGAWGNYAGWYPNRQAARNAVKLYRSLNP